MTERNLSAVVLAAGEGSRMRSTRPKPLHLLCGRAMVLYVLDALPAAELASTVVVVGHGAERVTKKLTEQSDGLRIYGAGIASSPTESVFAHVAPQQGDDEERYCARLVVADVERLGHT